jgi:hypothetical protein
VEAIVGRHHALSFQVTNRLQPWRIPRRTVNGAGSLLVPSQAKVKEFFVDFEQFPYQAGSSLSAAGINYGLLQQQAAMKRLKELEALRPR